MHYWSWRLQVLLKLWLYLHILSQISAIYKHNLNPARSFSPGELKGWQQIPSQWKANLCRSIHLFLEASNSLTVSSSSHTNSIYMSAEWDGCIFLPLGSLQEGIEIPAWLFILSGFFCVGWNCVNCDVFHDHCVKDVCPITGPIFTYNSLVDWCGFVKVLCSL